ncbi:MAG TPA: hypothetical protein VGS98_03310 [Thermoanaerobaculia bacterium]|jgi:hypothetical protein|nr:hypothetical protein [Thermoanaerobaculia bacterium]
MAKTTAAKKGSAGGPSADAGAIAAEQIMSLRSVLACGLIVWDLSARSDGATAAKLQLLSETLPKAFAHCYDLGRVQRKTEG